ncbi:MAG: hypothetical protein J5I81_13655 [Nitrococcus mobilis]|nr:hypothetical protein [Nitrococcus mobilis]
MITRLDPMVSDPMVFRKRTLSTSRAPSDASELMGKGQIKSGSVQIN